LATVQEGWISGRQMHPDVSDVPDIIFDAHSCLAATETVNLAMPEKGRSLALA